MKRTKKMSILIKSIFTLGIIFIMMGIIIQFKKEVFNLFLKPLEEEKKDLNLNIKEVDTYYENTNSIEYVSYVDTSWKWPTDEVYSISNGYYYHHPAIDIVTSSNLNIYSAYSGEVITNSYKYDNGNYLVIKQDNNYYVLYAHLSQMLVNTGDKVEKGQVIGIMGRTGTATGVHLHFSVWDGYPHNSNSINPFDFY